MPRWALPVLAALFFVSGACALVYQVMWLRMLALVFGVTVYAAGTVLASFMAGLALGSFTAGRLASRVSSPLRVFGLIEIGIGLSALATPALFGAVTQIWVALHPSLPSSLVFLTMARAVASFAVLIVPTTLMGATLPIVMRSALVEERAVASRIGLLYAINTTGAIAGALIAGFYFVGEIGLAVSFRIAAAANVTIGLLAIAASFALPRGPVAADAAAPRGHDAPSIAALSPSAGRAMLWTFALSGVLSLALEIVWFRMLVIFLRPTAYAFTIMLAAVLAGIALGSAIATPLLRRGRRWLELLTVVQLAIAIVAVLSLNTLAALQGSVERYGPVIARLGLDPYVAPIILASLLAMLPTTLLLGFAFPIGLSLWAGTTGDASRRIGTFYAVNVVGAIAGSVLGSFVLLPLLGSRGSLAAAASLALASSVLLAAAQWRTRPNFAGFMMLVGPVAFVMCALNAADPFTVSIDRVHRGETVLWREEAVQTTVAIHRRPGNGGPDMRVMYLDGMHQANDSAGTALLHHVIGALPIMLHPAPRTALVVGLGGGATAGAVARFPNVDVDVVELSGAVVRGSEFFRHINFDLLSRPTVHMRVDDGRNYLLTTRKRYDVVTADIILPRHAGAGALYAREYFELVRGVLNEGGLALQWNDADADTPYRLVMRTFLSVFPHTTLWGDGTLMIGSLQPFELSRRAYEERRQDPRFRELFDWDRETLRKNYLAGPDALRQWVGAGPILTDDRPRLEYFLSLPKDDPPADLRTLKGDIREILRP